MRARCRSKRCYFGPPSGPATHLTLVANQWLTVPPSPFIHRLTVGKGFDIADNAIAERVQPGDLVVTADVPLAAEVIARGGFGLDPRGGLYDENNVRERVAIRDFMDTLRGSGVDTGGPKPFTARDKQAFANALDRFLGQHLSR